MKTIVLILAMALTSTAQASEWTALVATQGAMVTIEKSIAPAPAPAPDSAPIGDAADHGKITLDIRVPAKAACPLDGSCRSGSCLLRAKELTPPVGNSHTQSQPGEACAGGVCPSLPPRDPETARRAAEATGPCSNGACSVSTTLRTRWRLFRR